MTLPPSHILSIDVEEYFQAEAAAIGGVTQERWESFESRVEPCVDSILEMLASRGQSATFFVLGWLAARHAGLVRRIAQAGHEIASHGMNHRMLSRMTPAGFRADLDESRKLLEDQSGKTVTGYRAPTFSITRETAWALDVLAEAGCKYDSSIFPIRHDRYGISGAPRCIHRAVGPGGGAILEIPPLTARFLGATLPLGGGGYLRLLPAWTVASAIRKAQRQGRPAMLYLHPWELDPAQPVLPMSGMNQWRHRVNLHKTRQKMEYLMDQFRFRSAKEVLAEAGDIKDSFQYNMR